MKAKTRKREQVPQYWGSKCCVFLTTLKPSDWGQKSSSEQVKTEDEEDSRETWKTLSSGSKVFVCDATS